MTFKGNRCNLAICKKMYSKEFMLLDDNEIDCSTCKYEGIKVSSIDPDKPYWLLYIYRSNKEHPEISGSYDYSEFASTLDKSPKESDFDHGEMYCLFNHKTRIVADIQKEGVKVFQPFADMIDWKSVEKD